ncbi:hypothetical protein A3A67_04905 [Candidatus Peribacteria bacterium RIFCSPLOWO2_01_FULL_51_18]|nr:MAG: hypothetical protein A3A67_04905 [Candidatus Peribacteria bacterium RIFCSPLOWO2_01_FULL_51_18]
MNSILPTSIETALKEAGFSGTEILLLKKLVEEDAMTLRGLATKTGKSTGVLDQAMKKLLVKGIAQRDMLNDQPKYSIHSLDTIIKWMERDMKKRHEQLDRRHQDFSSFVNSLKLDRHKPELEYFHGTDGIEQAYLKLLETGQELLTFTPILYKAEEDPLRAFRVDLFRKRQYRKIFQRIIAPDTTLARRYQSKDAFEYRKTLLVHESESPIDFEKTIVDGTIACINFTDQTACFLRYPELARVERASFESLWAGLLAEERGEKHAPSAALPALTVVPMKTRMLSRFREFILGKQSLAAFAIFALIAGAITFGLYRNAREYNLQRIRDKAISIAATGALQFDPKDISAVHTPADIKKPEYAKLIATLNLIRRNNEGIKWAYIWRSTNDSNKLAFVADADSLNPYVTEDTNGDGVIDERDQNPAPGDPYDISSQLESKKAFLEPTADAEPMTDQWGTFISGMAPIKNEQGITVAVLGVDMLASRIDELTAQSFSPLVVFVGLFILFVLIRFAAINKPLMQEMLRAMNLKRILIGSSIVLLVIVGLLYGLYRYTLNIVIEETGQRLMSIAATAASQFDPKDLNELHFARDMKKEAYQRVFKKLNEIRDKNPEITWAYIMRPTDKPDMLEFVADADSNYNLPNLWIGYYDGKKEPTEADEAVWPGYQYEVVKNEPLLYALKGPAFNEKPLEDQWGSFITGAASIIVNGKSIGIVGLDVDVKNLYKKVFYKMLGF